MNLSFHPQFIFRTPAFPFPAHSITEEELREIAHNKEFQEAIYIASPVLYDEMQLWLSGALKNEKEIKKVIYSLHKYYSRISTRCTPYGLFAACGVGEWGREGGSANPPQNPLQNPHNNPPQNPPNMPFPFFTGREGVGDEYIGAGVEYTITPRIRFDMDFVCSLSQHLIKHPAIQPHLLFYPNNSIYYAGNEVRYVQYKLVENKRVHSISSAIKSDYLLKVLEIAQNGALISTMSLDLTGFKNLSGLMTITQEDADSFIKELIDSQILVSELEPNITGREFIYELIEKIEEINKKAGNEEIQAILQVLNKVNTALNEMPKQVRHDSDGISLGEGRGRASPAPSLPVSPAEAPVMPNLFRHPDHFINDTKNEKSEIVYRSLFKSLKEHFPSAKETNLFQVDSFRAVLPPSPTATSPPTPSPFGEGMEGVRLLKTLQFLSKLSIPFTNPNLNDFKKRFNENYEGQEIPLLKALDTETGIGYPNKDTVGVNELVDDLPVSAGTPEYQIKWNNKEEFLLKKLIEAAKKDDYSISFTDADTVMLNSVQHPTNSPAKSDALTLPVTMSATFRVLDADSGKLQFMNVSGSAANLLGRFAYGDENILSIVKDITNYEKEAMPDKIIAEIVHLSESRIGNILLRPVFRDYEIPYLAKSSLPAEFQIPLNNLMVSIQNNRIFLGSKRLNKEILPRLSSAHNYSFNSLPVYKFLCDLQMQDVTLPGMMFSWGALAKSFKFLPRAEYDGVILHPATWNLVKADYDGFFKPDRFSKPVRFDDTDFMNKINEWKTTWKMPRYISLKDADNELLVDLESELSVKVFLDTIKNRPSIELVEFLFNPETALVRDEEGKPYNNEIIAILFYSPPTPSLSNREGANAKLLQPDFPPLYRVERGQGVSTKAQGVSTVPRSFLPGSQWLYYKIYCGVKTADKLLVGTIKPLVEHLKREKLLEKWFFIRYADPETHIRLRLYNSDLNKIPDISKIVYQFLKPVYEGRDAKFCVSTDTYIRELERYGANNIELTESLFETDSFATLNLLVFAEREKNEEIKWLYATRSTDYLLDSFGYNLQQKLNLMDLLKNNYFTEHGGQKELKLQLDDKFRKLRPQMEGFLNGKMDNDITLYEITSLLKLKRDSIGLIASDILKMNETGQFGVELSNLLGSYSHMAFNRIFKAKQRTYELVVYDMLHRYYKSQIARAKI